MRRIEGKAALVTGGAKGIGKAACLRLAEEGATVAVTDVDSEEGAAVVQQITEAGGTAAYWDLDVSDAAAVKTVFEKVHERFGRLDVLVNNAGISGADKPTDEVTEEEWDRVMDVNVTGVFRCVKAAIPEMRKNGWGKIVNISSSTIHTGVPMFLHYVSSKGAVDAFTRALAREVGGDNICVNSIA
ncbi:MAG TPA: SDR family NAD(P)-dependent oxidoreductase, partial [Rhodothermales bacterium]|nr:SDR family NAD(P)-dependent oxidoreductase [Rhodothermales bacterium]